MSQLDERTCITILSKNSNISIHGKVIQVLKDSGVGIKTWSKINYLINHCGYTYVYVTKLSKPKKHFEKDDDKGFNVRDLVNVKVRNVK